MEVQEELGADIHIEFCVWILKLFPSIVFAAFKNWYLSQYGDSRL